MLEGFDGKLLVFVSGEIATYPSGNSASNKDIGTKFLNGGGGN
jgi:hypothetical protein